MKAANPSICIDASVGLDITHSPAWARDILPNDAAALLCTSKKVGEYNMLAKQENNSEFGKSLCISDGRIIWNGPLCLRSTKKIAGGSQILATRGFHFWDKTGFPEQISKADF